MCFEDYIIESLPLNNDNGNLFPVRRTGTRWKEDETALIKQHFERFYQGSGATKLPSKYWE